MIHLGSLALDGSFSINLGEDFNPIYSKLETFERTGETSYQIWAADEHSPFSGVKEP